MLDYSDTYNQPIGATAFVLDWPSNAVVGFVPWLKMLLSLTVADICDQLGLHPGERLP